ncbi:MAG: 4-carboxymuconolactone decarboxylase [Gemmatimonadetes bacterium]|nr:4-carboxymuconolactone decarboxylase [Gemmatimonadota bacterium]
MSDESRFDAGMRVRRAVLGDAHVDRAEAAATAFDAPFQKFITETAWGTLWADDTLDHRTRSLITIALLAALGRHEELALHLRATANTGATPEEIRAALMHVAMYAGVPAANSAFTLAKTILDTQSRGQLRGQSWGQTPRAQPEGSDPLDRGQTPSGADPLATHGDSA